MSQQSFTWTVPLQITVSIPDFSAGDGHLGRAGAAVEILQPPRDPNLPPELQERWFWQREPEQSPEEVMQQALARCSLARLHESNYSWESALVGALCSKAAYEANGPMLGLHQQVMSKFDWQDPFSVGRTQGFVSATNEAVVVAYRGTQQTEDWITNVNVPSTYVSEYDANVHTGFYQAFKSSQSAVEDRITQAGGRDKPIIITGHSLGGALATIAAAEWRNKYDVAGVYTYGQPAVGLTNFRSYMKIHYRNNFHRFVNDDDIVPKVPPGYRHVGKLYHFQSDGNVRLEALAAEVSQNDTPTMSFAEYEMLKARIEQIQATSIAPVSEERLDAQLTQEGWLPSFKDHELHRYVQKVMKRIPA